jgi:hypothetical protein
VAHVGILSAAFRIASAIPDARTNQGSLETLTKRIENESGPILFHKRPQNPRQAALQTKDLFRALLTRIPL